MFYTFLPYPAGVGIIGCFAISPNGLVFGHCIWIQHVVRDSRLGLGNRSHDERFPLKMPGALQGAESSRVLNIYEKSQIHMARTCKIPVSAKIPRHRESSLTNESS